MNNFNEIMKARRSFYNIGARNVVEKERIKAIVEDAMLYSPTAMNSQSGRVVVLFDEKHAKLWNIVKETLRKVVPENAFKSTSDKIDSFAAGLGTVLFYEDQEVVRGLEKQFELYKDNFVPWSYQSSGMLQYTVWAGLTAEGLGASLQHYNPLIDDEVRKTFGIPDSYKLMSQMPFGSVEAQPGERNPMPVADRVKILS